MAQLVIQIVDASNNLLDALFGGGSSTAGQPIGLLLALTKAS